MATGSESKIDTKLFAATADTIQSAVKEIENLGQEWMSAMNGLRGAWQGDVSDNVKNTAEQVAKSAGDLLKALGAYPAALREIAGIYEKTEASVQETSKSLSFDKTFR
ncbi:MAG: WXG100 family type VII secretion target [Syntrophomonadaceae bacterium]|nr:WXG100 family type VII secretion target [Syntrophomonadaceae bacterium]